MYRGNLWIARVGHQAEAGCEEGQRFHGRRAGTDPLGQLRLQYPLDGGAVHPRLLEDHSLAEHTAHSTATTRTLPAILPE
jgi:hypothetical protein